jgi:hypothetical protein
MKRQPLQQIWFVFGALVAARLQQICKGLGRDVIVSETAYEMARSNGLVVDVAMEDVVTRRGRREPIRTFGVA